MNRRWLCLLLLPLLLGFLRLRFDVEVLNLLPGELPAVQGLKLYQEHFTNARELIITLSAADAALVEEASRALAAGLRSESNLVAEVVWQPPWQEHPELAAELVAHLWLNQPPPVFATLAARLAETNLPAVLNATREELTTTFSPTDLAQLAYDPFGLTRLPGDMMGMASQLGASQTGFGSPDGRFRVLFVKSREDLPGYRECGSWLAQIQTLARASVGSPEIALGFTGRPAFVAEISSSMQRDVTRSVLGTAGLIALLFWFAHRRWLPMLWLLTLLGFVLAATLAVGGLLFGSINVISLGFAAILLGLAVDYAVVHYQEALAHPDLSVPQIRRAIAPSIFWAALTTIAAFLVLNLGGLPGLAQLGSLVGIGVALSALVMIFAFLPPLFPQRMRLAEAASKPARAEADNATGLSTPNPHPANPQPDRGAMPLKWAGAISIALLLGCFWNLSSGFPVLNPTADALRPRDSQAYATLDAVKTNLNQQQEPWWVLTAGWDETEVAQRLGEIEPVLRRAVSNGVLTSFASPSSLWPVPAYQYSNRALALTLVANRDELHAAARNAGFAPEALGLTDEVLATWQRAAASPGVFWPTNPLSSWVLEKLTARGPDTLLAVSFLFPAKSPAALDSAAASALANLRAHLPQEGVWLSGWPLLGDAVHRVVRGNLWKLVGPMTGLVLLSLWLAFRRPLEILLSLAVLGLSGLGLLVVMNVAGWSWNLLNLMAAPLILGTGVDYSLFMQLALRRHAGDLGITHRSVGRALLLCGGTAVAGFGMLGLSSNAGMASLGQVCAVGIAGNMLIAVYLLPAWWRWLSARRMNADALPPPARPSSFYRARLWQLGSGLVRRLPLWLSESIARVCALIYWWFAGHRRIVVEQNLLPVLQGNAAAARRAARKLFSNFALKVIDLWHYETGAPILQLVRSWRGWEVIEAVQTRGRGVLYVTPHLGNWELGGAFLAQRGCKLLVLTQAEPDDELTELREAARARLGVDTLVVGRDAFAFVEVIKRLQAGEHVALLVDRPPPATAVTVQLFGQPIAATRAAAELARATGCGVVPVIIVRDGAGYAAEVQPEVPYDRQAIGDRAGRLRLTQEILRAFEPIIRQHVTQWYHFVPVWQHPPQPQPGAAAPGSTRNDPPACS